MPYNRAPHRSPRQGAEYDGFETPIPVIPVVIHDDMSFAEMCETLKTYFIENIDHPQALSAMKLTISHLGAQLAEKSYNPSTVAALLWCRAEFVSSDDDGSGFGMGTVGSSRALACEMVACDLTSQLSAVEALQYLCYELPVLDRSGDSLDTAAETSHLLSGQTGTSGDMESGRKKQYEGMNTLEIAVLADAKKFISHRPVQRIINGIWDGTISFWKSLDVDGSKSPHFFNPRTADPFCRLRVPKYQKTFEALFFAALLGFYFAVLIERNPYHITASEIALIIFFAAFAVDGFTSMRDSGVTFYNVWSWLDMAMIMIGIIFLIYRITGLVKHSDDITDTAFDVLSLEALLLVPRLFSLFSLIPYFGVLVPCLKQMTKEFLKFSFLIVILYFGFLTTFSLLARDRMSFTDVLWMLINVFFGSSDIGFDAMREISPILGPPLMLIFVTITNILLITSLISLLSNSLTTMMSNAREEYLFMFSIMVLEASTSNRLVVFYPPLNLLPLILLRPLRLFFPAPQVRKWRIVLLKLSHWLFASVIVAFERLRGNGQHTVWGPNSDRKSASLGLGISMFNRSSVWSSRRLQLAGSRLGLGAGLHATTSAASSVRLDDRLEGPSESRFNRFSGGDSVSEELRHIRMGIEELNRKMDAILSQREERRTDVD